MAESHMNYAEKGQTKKEYKSMIPFIEKSRSCKQTRPVTESDPWLPGTEVGNRSET